jgi:hypothetical protein
LFGLQGSGAPAARYAPKSGFHPDGKKKILDSDQVKSGFNQKISDNYFFRQRRFEGFDSFRFRKFPASSFARVL